MSKLIKFYSLRCLLLIVSCFFLTFYCSAQWFSQNSGTKATLRSVCFTDSTHGWAVGDSGTILKYDGKQWKKQNSGTLQNLYSVCFVDSLHGWAVGDSTMILKYNGKKWIKQNSGLRYNIRNMGINSVSFSDTLHGWAVGSKIYYNGSYYMLKYDGKQWIPIILTGFTGMNFNSVSFSDSNNGWAVGGEVRIGPGSYGVMIKYNRNIWTEPQSNYPRVLFESVHLSDSLNGWAVGYSNIYANPNFIYTNYIFKYFKNQWLAYITDERLISIYSTDKNNGWAVGESGTIVKFVGNKWINQYSGSINRLYSVFFTDSLNCWAVGEKGTILHTTSGGFSTNRFWGKITYDNGYNAPIKNTKLYLKNSEDIIIDSTITGSTGIYIFNNVISDKYTVEPKITIKWGGGNSTDALIICRNYIGLFKFSDNLLKTAADVNSDNKINPIDALLINRRFIKIINTFKAGDWIYEKPIITFAGSEVIQNIKVVCTGDVNGTFAP